MRITEEKYFAEYNNLTGNQINSMIESFDFTTAGGSIEYNTQVSAVYSSNIEGNSIDLNSFMNHKLSKEKLKPQKEIQEIENLILAYKYAQENKLNEKELLAFHKIFSKTLVIKSNQGKYRTEKVGVFDKGGLVYLAIESGHVQEAMTEFFDGIDFILNKNLTTAHVFYFASLIHLKFAHIHPFRDGNGRAARLIEKWFIAHKLGNNFWEISSEKYYKDHQPEYYNNINLGVNYYELNYDKCMPFLLMLPQCLHQ